MKGRMIYAFSFFVLVYALINFFIGWHARLFVRELVPAFPELAFWIAFAVIAFSYLIGRIPAPGPTRLLMKLLKVIGSYYFAVMEFGLIFILLADLIGGLLGLAGVRPDRFTVISGWTFVGIMAAILAWGSRNAWSPVVRTYRVAVNKRAEGKKELRIAVASDLHLGNIVGKRHLRRLIRLVNERNPDLILLPGDVIDDSIEPFIRNRLADLLRLLKAEHGVFAVLGNHEYYGGHIEDYVGRMKEIGIPVLRDERVEAGGVVIAGRKDRTAESMEPDGRISVDALLEGADRTKPVILMDHQPLQFGKAAASGVDLLLCGHTHRGQFAPNHWITRRLFELDWGYMRKDDMHVVVSSGFGTWGPPIRIASRSEIVLIQMSLEGS